MWKSFSCITIIIIFIYRHSSVHCLNCDSLVKSPEPGDRNGSISIQFVPELQGADYKELIACLATAGQAPMPQELANNLWIALKKVRWNLFYFVCKAPQKSIPLFP